MIDRIFIELTTRADRCQAVIVRRGDTLAQTPWLIGAGKECAESISRRLAAEYPETPQTRIGF